MREQRAVNAEGAVPAEFAGHFEGLYAGEIRFPNCHDCGRLHWYPMKRCPYCFSQKLGWKAVSGAGRLYSWTVVRFPFSPEHESRVPYVVGLVEFHDAPGTRLVTNIIETEPEDLSHGMQLEPIFHTDCEPLPRVVFRPAVGGTDG